MTVRTTRIERPPSTGCCGTSPDPRPPTDAGELADRLVAWARAEQRTLAADGVDVALATVPDEHGGYRSVTVYGQNQPLDLDADDPGEPERSELTGRITLAAGVCEIEVLDAETGETVAATSVTVIHPDQLDAALAEFVSLIAGIDT